MNRVVYGAGIIGAGAIFKQHARAYSQLQSRARLVALADVDAPRARNAAGDFFIPYVTEDYRDLLAREEVDIVSVCTPPSFHEQMVIDALEAGKFVVCEKPLAHHLASADRIVAAAEKYPDRLAVVYQMRFSPEVQRSVWLRDEGHLGMLQFGSFSRASSIPAVHRSGQSWWGRWDVAGGGALITQCIHEVDLALLLFGPARRVTATMATLASSIQSEDTISATVEHESGAIVSLTCALGHHVGFRDRWDVVGRDAAVHFPWFINSTDRHRRNFLQRESVRRFPGRQQKRVFPGPLDKLWRYARLKSGLAKRSLPSNHLPFIKAVLDAIDRRRSMPVSPAEARKSLELCVAIYTAAITDMAVELPLDDTSPFYHGISAEAYPRQRQEASA